MLDIFHLGGVVFRDDFHCGLSESWTGVAWNRRSDKFKGANTP